MNDILKLLGVKYELKIRRSDEGDGFVVRVMSPRRFVHTWTFTDSETKNFKGDILVYYVKRCITELEKDEA